MSIREVVDSRSPTDPRTARASWDGFHAWMPEYTPIKRASVMLDQAGIPQMLQEIKNLLIEGGFPEDQIEIGEGTDVERGLMHRRITWDPQPSDKYPEVTTHKSVSVYAIPVLGDILVTGEEIQEIPERDWRNQKFMEEVVAYAYRHSRLIEWGIRETREEIEARHGDYERRTTMRGVLERGLTDRVKKILSLHAEEPEPTSYLAEALEHGQRLLEETGANALLKELEGLIRPEFADVGVKRPLLEGDGAVSVQIEWQREEFPSHPADYICNAIRVVARPLTRELVICGQDNELLPDRELVLYGREFVALALADAYRRPMRYVGLLPI